MRVRQQICFLLLPLVTTLFNLVFAIFLLSTAYAQPVRYDDGNQWISQQRSLDDNLVIDNQQRVCRSSEDGNCVAVTDEDNEDDEEDPMLKSGMAIDPSFKAYVRADISSFYQEPAGSRKEVTPKFVGRAAKFINMSPERLVLYWEDERNNSHFIANIGPFEAGGTASFPDHKFFLAKHKTKEEVCRFVVQKGFSVYFCDPFHPSDAPTPYSAIRGTVAADEVRSLDELSAQNQEHYRKHLFNLEFGTQYKNFTGGSEWLAMYPRDPPLHKMWRADYLGQEHVVESRETHFTQPPPEELYTKDSYITSRRNETDSIAFPEYRLPDTLNLTIKAVSCAPRAFHIDNFLSEAEVDHVLDLVFQKDLKRSTTGLNGANSDASVSKTRTSKNTWLPRRSSPILDAIYRRAADALRLDEALLRHRDQDESQLYGRSTRSPINEDMQIVHYDPGQEYTAHHDFGYPGTRHPSPSRSINVCIYLNEDLKGGDTEFPRWRNAETREGLHTAPKKGKAMIFYMKNPDGNRDDLSQHAGLPVREGEKWFANLWIWDPYRT